MLDEGTIPGCVQIAVSHAKDEAAAVADATASLRLGEVCFLLVFVPGHFDGDRAAKALESALSGIPVFGCSSAGQITPAGYETEALLLLAFPRAHFRCASVLLEPLAPLAPTSIAEIAQRHMRNFQHTAGWSRLGLIFSDGLSKQEDVLISTLETVLSDLPIFGGSAGDALNFERTYVLHEGMMHENAAVLLLLETNLPFQGIGFDHFLPSEQLLVITSADPEARKVYEINGAPAATEYARLVGASVAELCPQVFAENPLLVEYKGQHYVRAISDAGADGALSFLAAIDDGLIMTLGQGKQIMQTLCDGLDVRDAAARRPDFILGFDCVLRKLEIEQKELGGQVSQHLADARVLGFNTYGEQHCGVHMNQTFVGVAFFAPEARALC